MTTPSQSTTNHEKYDLDILNEYSKVFGKYKIPNTLKLLAEFENKHGHETFGESFYLRTEENAFESYFDEDSVDEKQMEEYVNHMLPFAVADGTGGIVALWVRDKESDLEKAPIICYGSEGDISVVAQNIKEYVKILSFGAECMDGSCYHSIDDYDEESDFKDFKSEFLHYNPNFLIFRKWMKDTLDVTPVKKWDDESSSVVDKIIEKAQKKLNKSFDKWQYQFYPNPDDEYEIYKREKVISIDQELLHISTDLQINPKDFSLCFKQAKLMIEKAELQKEKLSDEQKHSLYEKVLTINENHEESLQALADIYEYKDTQKALIYLKRIQVLENPKENPLSAMGSCYERLGMLEEALECYIKDVQRHPNLWGYSQKHVIKICEKLGKDYMPILEKFIQEQKDTFSCNYIYELYFKQKNYPEALKYFSLYAELNKKRLDTDYFKYAEKFYKKNAFAQAKEAFEISIVWMKNTKRKADCYNYLGVISTKLDYDIKTIMNYYKKAVELNPAEKIYQANLNNCLEYMKENNG